MGNLCMNYKLLIIRRNNLSLLTDIRWRTTISIAIILPLGLLYSHYRFSVSCLVYPFCYFGFLQVYGSVIIIKSNKKLILLGLTQVS